MLHRRLARGPMLHRELREAHASAVVRLRSVDADLQQLLEHRRALVDELESLRTRVERRWSTRHGGRRRPLVDESPVPPEPPDPITLAGNDLRAVAIRLLRQHGRHRLRDLHGLLHCYGYAVAGPEPVKALAEAMRWETRCGRARRVERGVYEAEPEGDDVPYPRWLGHPPEPSPPLPWSEPVSAPGPPLIDPLLAEDPVLWSGGGHPEPAPADEAEPDGPAPAPPTGDAGTPPHRPAPEPPDRTVGSDSGPNRSPRCDDEGTGRSGTESSERGSGPSPPPDEPP